MCWVCVCLCAADIVSCVTRVCHVCWVVCVYLCAADIVLCVSHVLGCVCAADIVLCVSHVLECVCVHWRWVFPQTG